VEGRADELERRASGVGVRGEEEADRLGRRALGGGAGERQETVVLRGLRGERVRVEEEAHDRPISGQRWCPWAS
jgi:hypothetical protein